MANEPNQNFLDGKTIMAIVLVGVCWLGWQSYMQSKYPHLYQSQEQTAENQDGQLTDGEAPPSQTASGISTNVSANETRTNKEIDKVQVKESLVKFEDEIWRFSISSKGMGLKNIELKDYTTRDGKEMSLGSDEASFASRALGMKEPLDFAIEKTGEGNFVGLAQFGAATIEKRMSVDSEKHTISTTVLVSGLQEEKKFSGISTDISDRIVISEKSLAFLPQFEQQEIFINADGDDERIIFTQDNEDPILETFPRSRMVSIGSQYFAQAFLDKSEIIPEVKAVVSPNDKSAGIRLSHEILSRKNDFKLSYVSYIGPKSLNLLSSIDKSLSDIVNFGWFGGLGEYILKIMKFFYQMFGNWGVAIILLTLLVRMLLMPFHLWSIKSMKKMQAIQPQVKALREKYKDDPTQMNQEMMTLFKSNRVNPLGGCLPMLLQFPVFIALYQMLGQSIELYQAPFVFWIHDLSIKDPYYVLPILMGLAMFLQQKLTPNTMEPAQQKIFMFMPVFFSLLMVTLPSGLTLYMFVSALFAVIQQVVFLRDRTLQPAS